MILVSNRKIFRDYEILDKYYAGIVLYGHEVKAIREGNMKLEGSYVKIIDGKPYLINAHIEKYSKLGISPEKYNSLRDRQLLLNRNEINKIVKETMQKGKSAVPLAIFLKNNLIKVEFAVVKGKKNFEKKQQQKDLEIGFKQYKAAKTRI